MSANPPILSIPAQSPDPVSHIKSFLASLAPHVSEHAAIGAREFGNQRAQSQAVEEWRGRASSLDVDPGQRQRSEGTQREDFRLAAATGLAFRRHHDLPDSRRRPFDGRLQRIDATPQAARVARHSDPNTLPVDCDMGSVSPTESARRRYARKIRRREKAAILNAGPPPSPTRSAHPHPAPKRRSQESDSEAGRALSEILSGERRAVRGRDKRRRTQPGMDLIRRWKPENVVTSRLTMRPGTKGLKGGILGKAKTSLPIRAPYRGGSKAENPDGKRVRGIAESDDEMHLWRRRPEQRGRSHRRTHSPTPDATEGIHSRTVGRGLESQSRNALSPHLRATGYDRLPSAGITNSPSWPSFTTHQRSDPPVVPAHSVNIQVAPQSSTGSMGYREPFSSLAHSPLSAQPVPHTGVQAPRFAPRPDRETWKTGRQPKPIGSQPAQRSQPEYQHPLQHIDDLSSSFAQHLEMLQTTQPYCNGKSPLYPTRRTIYGQLLSRDRASALSEIKPVSSSPLFPPKAPAIPSFPVPFGGPSELKRVNRPVAPVGDIAGSPSVAARHRDRGDVHIRVDLSSSPFRSTSGALPRFDTDSSPISIRIPTGGRRDHHVHHHAFQSMVHPAIRRNHEFTAVDGVAYRGAIPPTMTMEWDRCYGKWEYRDDVSHTGADHAGQAGQTEESWGQGQWQTDGMESGSFVGPNEPGPWSVPGEGSRWIGSGDDPYGNEVGGARVDDDVYMGTGMGKGMGVGMDIGFGGMDRDPPPSWQQRLDRSAQVGRSTPHTGDDEWKRFWQRRNDG